MVKKKKNILKMRIWRQFIILAFGFLLLTIFSLTFLSSYTKSAPAYTFGYQTTGYFGGQMPIYDREMCGAGQDFILQIDPLGCVGTPVRSDLLEEQPVSVLCPVYATQLNPLIKVENINQITISQRDYPKEVLTVGYYPARAALGKWSDQITRPVFDNIGYANIVLRQQRNESAMPDFVEGNLTANIRYNIHNAFGTGRTVYYLPKITDEQFNRDYPAYAFWDGRGYLRLEDSEGQDATIGVYSDRDFSQQGRQGEKSRIAKLNLEVGKTGKVFMPGFNYCLGGVDVTLSGLETPDKRARIRIDSEVLEIKKGDKFLDNQCAVRDIIKQGINQYADISCKEDNGNKRFTLRINPKINLSIGDVSKEYGIGDRLYEDADNGIYLGFIGNNETTNAPEGLYVWLFSVPKSKESASGKLTEAEISYIADFDRSLGNYDVRTGFFDQTFKGGEITLAKFNQRAKQFFTGKKPFYLGYADPPTKEFAGKKVDIIGYSGVYDIDLEQTSEAVRDNYEKAMDDFDNIEDSFASDIWPETEETTLGEQAMIGKITLATDLGQRKKAAELCQEFSENYPNSITPSFICGNEFLLANTEISGQSVVVNGQTHTISFEGAREPGFNEFGLILAVTYPDGRTSEYSLSKDEVVYLSQEPKYSYKAGTFSSAILYRYYNNKWQWSPDDINWMDTTTTVITGGKDAGKQPVEEQKEAINYLQDNNLDLEAGASYLLRLGAKDITSSDLVQLTDLTEDSATLKTSLSGESLLGATLQALPSHTLDIRQIEDFGSKYSFQIKKINLEKVARVSLNPEVDFARTNATFSFKIGIEKRGIQLSPEKTTEKIKKLNETIQKLERVSNTLGNIVEAGKKACAYTSGILTVKNFLSNLGGKGIARQKVMRGTDGWYDQCQRRVNAGEYDDMESCLLDNSAEIEASVNVIDKALDSQNAELKKLQEGISKTSFLGETVVNTDALTAKLVGEFKGESDACTDSVSQVIVAGQKVGTSAIASDINASRVGLTQIRDLQLYCRLLGSSDPVVKDVAQKQVEKLFGEIYSNSEPVQNTFAGSFGRAAGLFSSNQNIKKINIEETKQWSEIQGDFDASGISIADSSLVYKLKDTSNAKEYLLVLDEQYVVRQTYNISGRALARWGDDNAPNPLAIALQYYDAGDYENLYENPTVRYYETDPYRGLPAVVPFDLENGWYAAIKSTLPVLGGLRAYDDSGRVSSWYVCNVGENKREEFIGNDDNCLGFVPKTGAAPKFSGLTEQQSYSITKKAEEAILQASDQYGTGVKQITIRGVNKPIKVGEPSAEIPDIQCEDFMSPGDCNLMFNVCDPFICPSSRCDLGGNYPVKDVIQSGIIGSLALCLPNFPEVKVPICVSGVHAGVEAWTNVWRDYAQCLQTGLETGQTVGICDEINSVYTCEFVWRQGLPVVKYGAPKVLGALTGQNTRGGGEYLATQDALDNVGKSFEYFTQYYADDAYKAFKARSAQQVGTEFCRGSISAVFPGGGDALDTFATPDSPAQFLGRFDEIPVQTVTNPPSSHYKVFYHIYAGKDLPAYFQVYLRGTPGSFYQDTDFQRPVASGFIPAGDFKTETKDFTAPSGYKELCIVVNGQEECGFKEVTTEFGLNYLTEEYVARQASETDVDSEKECVSGSPDAFNLLNPSLLSGEAAGVLPGVSDTANPAIYNRGIIRVCATKNPGQGTDASAGTESGRWKKVGNCGSENLGCWLDTQSVRDVIKNTAIENRVLGEVTEDYMTALQKEGNFINTTEFESLTKEILELQGTKGNDSAIIKKINEKIDKVFYNNQKGYLHLLRGVSYSNLARLAYSAFLYKQQAVDSGTPGAAFGTTSKYPVLNVIPGIPPNLYYTYSGVVWYFSEDRSNWINVEDFEVIRARSSGSRTLIVTDGAARFNEQSDKNQAFIASLRGKSYSEGLQLMIEKIVQDGGLVFDAKLSTENVDMSYKKVFSIDRDVNLENLLTREKYSITAHMVFFTFADGKWRWSLDESTWEPVDKYSTKSASFTVNVTDDSFMSLLQSLEARNEIEGAVTLFNLDAEYLSAIGTTLKETQRTCEDCGQGLWNGCDETECRELSRLSGVQCEFEDVGTNSCTEIVAAGEAARDCEDCGNGFPTCKKAECDEIGEQNGKQCTFNDGFWENTCTEDLSTDTGTCTDKESCQKVLGAEVIKIAAEEKNRRSILDENIKKDTGASSFECLVLQVAYIESEIQQCREEQSNEDPLYCEGSPSQTLSNLKDEASFGAMQLNTAFKNSRGENVGHCGSYGLPSDLGDCREQLSYFETNVRVGIQHLISGYDAQEKVYRCHPQADGRFVPISYSGWENAIRNYNGWNTNCSKGNPSYVEEVKDAKTNVGALFSQCK